MRYTKMHGAGNSFLLTESLHGELAGEDLGVLAQRLCSEETGPGADGMIVLVPAADADLGMLFFNSDGSRGEMCGNGARCVGRYLHDKGLTDKTVITLETLSGIKILTLHPDETGQVREVSVGMGPGVPMQVLLPGGETGTFVGGRVRAAGQAFTGTAIDMGNPHLVLFVEDALAAPVAEAGPVLERLPMFPDRANIEFAQILDETHIRMRVWERGSGITAACGTGACATAVAAAMAGLTRPENCTVLMDGGALSVSWDPDTKLVTMTGPAETVFEGTIETP